ncbi:class I SAM-dependent methyltransferase [Clostridium sp. UBA1652]|uniref:class I SAM-dependent methyltransferase n=1 Tax=Clostridium sp. UBA1652 TaxID=1946348 RepID=UPI00257AF9CE|nr:class I SAM-dependent methyltransferase [Clostridium sp. UBA1652]
MNLTSMDFLEVTRSVGWNERVMKECCKYMSCIPKPSKIIELGCGNGFFSNYVAEYFSESEVTGLDINWRLIQDAKVLCTKKNVQYEAGDATATTYADDTFDCVYTHLALVDCQRPEEIMKEALRITKPRGYVFFFEPIYQIDFLNTYFSFLKQENIEMLQKLYKIMLIDLPKKKGIDRKITIQIPKILEDFGYQDVGIQVFHTYLQSSDIDDIQKETWMEQSINFIKSYPMVKRNLEQNDLLMNFTKEEAMEILDLELEVATNIVRDEKGLSGMSFFCVSSMIGFKVQKR